MFDILPAFSAFVSFRSFAAKSFRAAAVIAALEFFICFTSPQIIGAATYTVTNNADSGAGSLRQAVSDANTTADNDTIIFSIPAANCNAATGVCTITLTAEIIITNNGALTITGTGANRLTVDGGAGTNRVFTVTGATATIIGLTITGGKGGSSVTDSGNGGGIFASGGTLVLRGVNVTGNSTGSAANLVGGGVILSGTTNSQILNSTISFNTSTQDCGGFYSYNSNLTITNTTISDNSSGGNGGGFCSDSTVTARNITVTNNNAAVRGGGFKQFGTFTFVNSIIAGNTTTTNFQPEIFFTSGSMTSLGYNLVGDSAGDSTGTGTAIAYQTTDIQNTPPLLDALGNYGGTIPTRRLQATSPAIDKGSLVAGVGTDGRGVIRPFDNSLIANAAGGDGSDIGAFELETSIVKDWGYNFNGQLGLGNTTNPQSVPQTLTGFNDITQFGGGDNHSIALRSDGTVVTAGNNTFGQLGNGAVANTNRPNFAAVTGANVVNITAVSSGNAHNLALKSDGTVWAWGYNGEGGLGNGSNTNTGTPVQVGASVAGFNGQVVQVSAGYSHNLALTADGKVWAWGNNGYGQLGDGTNINRGTPVAVLTASGGTQLSGAAQISAGEVHSAALKTDGSVVVWGFNADGQVGNGTASANSCLCVNFPAQTTNTLMGTVTSISAGRYHTVALKENGDVWAWGQGGSGAIGDNNTANALAPRRTTISNVARIEANGAEHTLARTRAGQLFAWGYNFNGQIGNGTTTQQNTPLNISSAAGAGGNLGTNIAVFGTGRLTSFAATVPQAATPAGASTLRGDNFSVAFPASTAPGTTQIRAFDPMTTGLTAPAGYTILANSTGYDFTTTAAFTGTVAVCLKVSTVIDQTIFNRLFILHDDNGDGTLDAIAPTRDYQRREICRSTTSFSPFVLAQGSGATAATVSIGGRITSGKRGITNIRVTLTDANGEARMVLSSQFGCYRFAEVEAGQTYTISVTGKRYSFANSVQIRSITNDTGDVDFQADN